VLSGHNPLVLSVRGFLVPIACGASFCNERALRFLLKKFSLGLSRLMEQGLGAQDDDA
jgi:hypothetical protein